MLESRAETLAMGRLLKVRLVCLAALGGKRDSSHLLAENTQAFSLLESLLARAELKETVHLPLDRNFVTVLQGVLTVIVRLA